MNKIKTVYFLLLGLALLGVLFFIWLGTSLEYGRISSQRNGTWDASMGGAGMAMIAPAILTMVPFMLANILGLTLLFLDRTRKLLKREENIVIIVCLLLLIGCVPVLYIFDYLLTFFAGILVSISQK